MNAELQQWIEQQIGPFVLLDSVARRGATVASVAGPFGQRFFGKQVRYRAQWAAEVNAYRSWTPDLGDIAPQLCAADERLQTLLVSALPGRHPAPATHDRSIHHNAGRVLRSLHESRPAWWSDRATPDQATHAQVSAHLERLLARKRGLFNNKQIAFARRQVQNMAALPVRAKVPCHGDFRPHNWLVDDTGTLRVIDFGSAQWHVPAWDLSPLYQGYWWVQPDLARAFFDGYGRCLDEDEREFVRLHLVVNAIGLTWLGNHYQRPAREALGRKRLRQLMAGHPTTV